MNVDCSILEAVKQAVNSPLLDTTIEGAENILINTSGKVDIMALSSAINYVRELAGDKVNIIWGTVTEDNFDTDKIVVTLIATGMSKNRTSIPRSRPLPKAITSDTTKKPSVSEIPLGKPIVKPVTPSLKEKELVIPPFLLETSRKRKVLD